MSDETPPVADAPKPVTDPELIKKLEAAPAAAPAAKPVSDPELIKKLNAAPAGDSVKGVWSSPPSQKVKARVSQRLSNEFKQMDPGVDYSGVNAPKLRAEYGFLDTPEEKTRFLQKHFGEKNVTKDTFGRDVVVMNGQKVAFLPRGGQEEGKKGSTASQWADVASDVAPVGGMVLGSLATAPFPGAAIAGAGVGAAGGRGINKLIKEVMSDNLQTTPEIAKDIGKDVVKGAAAQASGEVLGIAGRSIFRGPFREGSIFGPITQKGKEMFAKAQEEVSAARAMGLKPKVGTYSPNAAFTQRVQNAGFRLFGDELPIHNRPIIEREAAKFTGGPISNAPHEIEAASKGIVAATDQVVKTYKAVADAAKVDAETLLKGAEASITSRVGEPSGELAYRVASDIQAAKTAFTSKAAEMYGPVDALAGKPVVPTSSLKGMMKQILEEGPQTVGGDPVFATEAIKKFAGDINKLPDNITFQQMQVARSTLRDYSAMQALNVGLSERQAARLAMAADDSFNDAASLLLDVKKTPILDASGKPITTVTPRLVEGVEGAKEALRTADKFYRDGIQKFHDLTAMAMVKDASQTGFVQPEMVASRLAMPGQNDKLLRIKELVTPSTFGEIGAAKWGQILTESKDPLTGNVSGISLARKLTKMGPVLETLYGKAEAGRMTSYAEHLAALNGDFDAGALESGRLSEVVKDAVMKKEASDEMMKRGFIKNLQSDGPQSLDAAKWLTEPEHRQALQQAFAAFGPKSQEANNIREFLARRIFSEMEIPASKNSQRFVRTELSGEPLQTTLDRYGPVYLEEVFGKQWTDSAYKFAKAVETATRQNPQDSGQLIAAMIGIHPIKNIAQIVRFFASGELLSKDPVITYMSRGVESKGLDFLQNALGRATQVGLGYEAEEVPKKTADYTQGLATHARSKFGDMINSTGVRP